MISVIIFCNIYFSAIKSTNTAAVWPETHRRVAAASTAMVHFMLPAARLKPNRIEKKKNIK